MRKKIKPRLKYWAIAYLLFFFLGLMMTGIPNLYYLSPIKIVPLLGMLILGNLFYYSFEEGMDRYLGTLRMAKYVLLAVVIIFVSIVIHKAFFYESIDLTILFGFPM